MTEGPIDEFLNQMTAKRQPLTDLEKREAIRVAWEIQDIAKGKIPKGKEGVSLRGEKQTETYLIYNISPTSEDIPSWAPQDSTLRIDVLKNAGRNALGRMILVGFNSYYISSSDIIKQAVIYSPNSRLEELENSEKIIKKMSLI